MQGGQRSYICIRKKAMKKLQISRALMIAAILLIAAFQAYWLTRLYKDESEGLKKEANGIFRDVVYNLQVERFKADTLTFSARSGNNLFIYNAVNALRQQIATAKKNSRTKKTDSPEAGKEKVLIMGRDSNTAGHPQRFEFRGTGAGVPPEVVEIMKRNRSNPAVAGIDSAVLNRMAKAGMKVVVNFDNKSPDSNIHFQQRVSANAALQGMTVKTDLVKSHGPGPVPDGFPEKSFVRMITNGRALDDTLPVSKLDSAYKKELKKAGIPVAFSIKKGKDDSVHRKDTIAATRFRTSPAVVGFVHPYWYQAEFESPAAFLFRKISAQALFSLFLVAFTTISFIFLYRNLAAQQRLTVIKNDFISNITHELKTPIATVNVAIEALRNFGGLQSPERTKEYLDISASELQRLSLLVDKVLKLSMFENHEITLQKESFDLLHLIEEVMSSMKLQFEKQKAIVTLETTGQNFMMDADKLHITSVVYNLLDNALKYSKEDPHIGIKLERHAEYFELRVSDNGIGIAEAYRSRIFEQFFRVPSGNRHNIKGYGLGLSYVNHIVKQHHGFIEVESELGKGSTFIVKLPFAETGEVHYDRGRAITKRKSI
ncbi:MAG: histidine kinase [Sediminibacterium sp.]|nr:histidine kinase [Sediminibacterium sp.]